MYILNDYTQNYPFCRLQLVVETFEHLINQFKCPQSCKANEKENVKFETLWTNK